jgi:ABC-type phosphate/phosphonate transport system ATPase subunit
VVNLNPLADPGLVGVSIGAALAAVSVIVLGAALWRRAAGLLGTWTLPTAAFAGSLATTLLVYRRATIGRRVAVATMLLAGIAVNPLVGALTGLLIFAETDDMEIARQTLGACGVLTLAERLYPTLSGGEQQRVHLSCVLAQVWEVPSAGARYMLLDEPTAILDLAHQHRTLALARRFAREGGGMLAVLHDLNLAAQYADRLCLLTEGRLLAQGSPAVELTPDQIQAAFGLRVTVAAHPSRPGPLVVPLADIEQGVLP